LRVVTTAEEDVMMNRMAWTGFASILCAGALLHSAFAEGIPHNGLSNHAFRANALTTNAEALETLLQHKLDDALLTDKYLARQLRDPNARAMMRELVSCALNRSTRLEAGGMVFSGELGLCQAWHDAPPTVACQELVTACIAARVNALRESIPISLRGESLPLFGPSPWVPTVPTFREGIPGTDPSKGRLIESFSTCGPGQECQWRPAHVGTCRPGQQVQLAIEDPASCSTTRLRVCDGVHGCYRTPPVGFVPRLYSAYRNEADSACPGSPLTFTCPSELGTRGYYSVMFRAPQPGSAAPAITRIAGDGVYPAPEAQVFRFPEGAFFGNLFKPQRLNRSCQVGELGQVLTCTTTRADGSKVVCEVSLEVPDPDLSGCLGQAPGIPYDDVYACYSYAQQQESADDDELSTAAFNARMCDVPDSSVSCFRHKLRRCRYTDDSKNTNLGISAGCEPVGSTGAFDGCRGQGDDPPRYRQVITTYLHDPCDLIGDRPLCDRVRRTLLKGNLDTTGTGRGPRGCGGCSTSTPGSLLAAALGAVALLGGRRRRRRGR
jgi:MYXO-CTERM domain-containing protein